MKKISKFLYISPIVIFLVLAVILEILVEILSKNILMSEGYFIGVGIFFVILFIVFIYYMVMSSILLHKLWNIIQSDCSRTTPAKAVGFMFIPIFSLYWAFQAYWGWTKDYNSYIEKNNIDVAKMPEKITLWTCIMMVMSFLPGIKVFASLAFIVGAIYFTSKAINGFNALVEHNSKQQ
jgi:hypothetical protein